MARRRTSAASSGHGARRHRFFTWYRVLLLGVLLVLVGATLAFLRGPAFWQKRYYPLKYTEQITASAKRHGLNPYLVAAVINAESGFDPSVKSSAGAVGLMQVLPDTAKDLALDGSVDSAKYPRSKLSDPAVNIEYGSAYLRQLITRYHEVEAALAAYNAGLVHVDKWSAKGGNIRDAIEFPETKAYVLKVVRGKDRYAALYPDAFPWWHAKQ